MANNLLTEPLSLTNPANPLNVRTGLHIIKRIEWVNPLEYEDQALLLDADDNIIFSCTCKTPHENYKMDFGPKGIPFIGPFNLSLIDSGTLLIYRV